MILSDTLIFLKHPEHQNTTTFKQVPQEKVGKISPTLQDTGNISGFKHIAIKIAHFLKQNV